MYQIFFEIPLTVFLFFPFQGVMKTEALSQHFPIREDIHRPAEFLPALFSF
jgi:hypothetical protein